jgi:hypothetical protein
MYLLLAATPLTSSRRIHANTLMESTIGLFMTELIKPPAALEDPVQGRTRRPANGSTRTITAAYTVR